MACPDLLVYHCRPACPDSLPCPPCLALRTPVLQMFNTMEEAWGLTRDTIT